MRNALLLAYPQPVLNTAIAAVERGAASQYALLTSICALPGSLLAGVSGFAVERLGFEHFFVETSLIGGPVAIFCWWVCGDSNPR